jgi:transcriptional regulator with XRE-family HTH domain
MSREKKTMLIFSYMKLKENLRELRKRHGWTQTELGEKIGVSQKIIADYETGATNPPVDRLPILAKVLKVTVDQVLGLEDIQDKPNKKKRVHKNTRLAKMEKVFEKLKPEDQRSILKQARGIVKENK